MWLRQRKVTAVGATTEVRAIDVGFATNATLAVAARNAVGGS